MKATHHSTGGGLGLALVCAVALHAFPVSAAEAHWAFKALSRPAPPAGGQAHPIDRFIDQKLRAEKLFPLARAGKETLFRRVSFDLTGLPPPPEELDAYLNDTSEDSWTRVIERLLASPHYGERWGRHWMDVARYADTAGDNADYPVPEAYRYRDYIIRAFNLDLPYDQFVREQLAGDILAQTGPRARYEDQVVATGFLALSRRYATGPYELWHLTLENTIETVGQAFLGLNLRCARCHDHKYDPVSITEYYGLYGIFSSTDFPWPGGEELQSKSLPRQKFVALLPDAEAEPRMRAWRQKIDSLRAQIDQTKEKDKLAALKIELRNFERRGLPADVPSAYAVQEGKVGDTFVQLKGEPEKKGLLARRAAPHCAGGGELNIPEGSSGRREFADWLTSKENPLFARVMVNRLWQHHFGKGLVATPNNFGLRGEAPSHPELLDYLAVAFVDSGYSVKAMHRLMLGSEAYRRSSADQAANAEKDPANRYLWRFDRQRLEAEAIRDAMLAVSGVLDTQPAGPHPFPSVDKWNWTQHTPFKEIYSTARRSVYLMTPRFQRHPFLALFDGPDTNTSTEMRRASIVPQQALYALNNSFVDEQARLLAVRISAWSRDEGERVRYAQKLAWGREPTAGEIARAREYLTAFDSIASDEAWPSFARVLLTANEFIYVD